MQTNVAKVRRRGENLVHENLVLEFVADEVENDDDDENDEPEVARSGKRRRREDIPSPRTRAARTSCSTSSRTK